MPQRSSSRASWRGNHRRGAGNCAWAASMRDTSTVAAVAGKQCFQARTERFVPKPGKRSSSSSNFSTASTIAAVRGREKQRADPWAARSARARPRSPASRHRAQRDTCRARAVTDGLRWASHQSRISSTSNCGGTTGQGTRAISAAASACDAAANSPAHSECRSK